MTWRFADGSDKIAAFERGLTNEQANIIFETPGNTGVVIEETYLVAYGHGEMCVIEWFRTKLYDGKGSVQDVKDFLAAEAKTFQLSHVCSVVSP